MSFQSKKKKKKTVFLATAAAACRRGRVDPRVINLELCHDKEIASTFLASGHVFFDSEKFYGPQGGSTSCRYLLASEEKPSTS